MTHNLRDLINTQLIAIKSSALITAEGVNYSALANSAEYLNLKQEIVACLQTFDLRVLRSQAEKPSFWINIYNLLTIDGVIHHRVKKTLLRKAGSA